MQSRKPVKHILIITGAVLAIAGTALFIINLISYFQLQS